MSPRTTRHSSARAHAIAAFLFVLGLVACANPEDRLAEHMKRGKELVQQQRYEEAVIELRSALSVDPNHADAHWQLALVYRDFGDPRRAFWELQETLRLDPDNLQAKIYYSRTLALSSSEEALTDALTTADEVVAEDPTNPEAHIARGRALQGLRRFTEAKDAFREAARLAPDDGEPLRRLANVYRMAGENEDAEQIYRQATEVDPGFNSFINLAAFLMGADRPEEAEPAFRGAIEGADTEQSVQAYGLYSGFLVTQKRFDEAAKLLGEGLEKLGGNQTELVYALAKLHEARDEPEEAEDVLRRAAEAAPDQIPPLITLAAFLNQRGDAEGAMTAVEAALAIDPTDPAARLRQADLMTQAGIERGDRTLVNVGGRILDEVIESGAPNVVDALIVKGRLALARGKPREAEATLRRAIDRGALSWRAHFLLATALFARGDAAGARTALAQARALGGTQPELLSLKARVHSAMGESDLALREGLIALRRTPGDTQLRLALLQAHVDSGRPGLARRLLSEVPEDERPAPLLFASGRLYEREGKLVEARASYEAAHRLDPHQSSILGALLELDRRDGRLAESSARIEAAAEARPRDASLARLAGRSALLQGEPERARQSFERAIQLDPNDLQAYSDLASMLARAGEPSAVLGTFEKALEANPQGVRLNLLLGMLYERQGRIPDAIARYEVAAAGDDALPLAKNNLAYLLAEHDGDLDRALELATEAKELLPEDPSVADTLGWVLFKKGLVGAAVGYLREAERGVRPQDPLGGLVRVHLAKAYQANGEPVPAAAALERALAGRDLAEDQTGPGWVPEARVLLEGLRSELPEPQPDSEVDSGEDSTQTS